MGELPAVRPSRALTQERIHSVVPSRPVDAKVIGLGSAPVLTGVGAVIFPPLPVDFPHQLLGGLLTQMLSLHPAPDTFSEGGADEQTHHGDAGGAEDEISAPAHNDAGGCPRQVQNDLTLHLKENVLRRLALPHPGAALIDAGEQPGIGGLFILPRKQLLLQPGFLGCQGDELPVIAGDLPPLRQQFSDLPTAAAELTAQSDHGHTHPTPSI